MRRETEKNSFTRATETDGDFSKQIPGTITSKKKKRKKKNLEVIKEVITTLPREKWGPGHSNCPLDRKKANVWISPGYNS